MERWTWRISKQRHVECGIKPRAQYRFRMKEGPQGCARWASCEVRR